MIRYYCMFALVAAVLAAPCRSTAQTAAQKSVAAAFMDAFTQWQPERILSLLHPDLLKRLTEESWKTLHDDLLRQGGAYRQHRYYSGSSRHDIGTMVYRVFYARDSLEFRVAVDSLNLVEGFWIDFIEQKYKFPFPPYVRKKNFTEKQAAIGDSSLQLPALVAVPRGKGPFPAVVLVHDAGPQDMDMTVNGNKPFRDIAWGLASSGVMVLRYHKRTKVLGRRFDARSATVASEFQDDVRAAIRYLLSRKDVDSSRLGIAGMGLGGMTLPDLARAETAVRGIALLSVPARPLEDVIETQLRERMRSSDSVSGEERSSIETQLAALHRVRKKNAAATEIVMGAPASYFYDLRARDHLVAAALLDVPILLLSGGKDVQRIAVDDDIWARTLSTRPKARIVRCESCMHVLVETALPAEQAVQHAQGHVAKRVIDALVDWAKHTR